MLKLPEVFERNMKADLADEYSDFIISLNEQAPTSIRLNPIKYQNLDFDLNEKIKWSSLAYYLNIRPQFTFDPYFHAGHYYVQEASSIFLEQAIKQSVDLNNSIVALDMCAAPGGKSTLINSLISDESLLISNEVINTRASILVENLTKWGYINNIVTNNDPEHFNCLENSIDLLVLDAPCSGEGMFRKDPSSINEWSIDNVNICSARQTRILNSSASLVKEGGILIYSTCTYNSHEDWDPILNLVKNSNEWESIRLDISNFIGIKEKVYDEKINVYGYHFYPHKIKGEGFFITVLRRVSSGRSIWPRAKKDPNFLEKKTKKIITEYTLENNLSYITHNNNILAFPNILEQEMLGIINTSLRIKKFGVELGQIIRDELIPSHAFAMSNLTMKNFNSLNIDKANSIQYLQKKDINVNSNQRGWHLIKYKDATLGFAKLMGNRMNNYYPKEYRIRTEINESKDFQ